MLSKTERELPLSNQDSLGTEARGADRAFRVIHCIPSMKSGGAERQLIYLVGEQRRRGLEVHVALAQDGSYLAMLEATGARVHKLSASGNYDPRLLVQLVLLLRRLQPHIVQTWLTQMDVLGGTAALTVRVPWILSERSSGAAYADGAKNWLRSAIARHAYAVISNSPGGDRYWARSPGMRRYVIPNSLPYSEIAATEPIGDDALRLPAGYAMVLSAGRLSRPKNLKNMIPAIARAASRAHLVAYLCGEGDARAATERLVDEYSPPADIRLMGYVGSVWRWMKRADVFVSVSTYEGLPNSVLEAILCGCPLVLSDIPIHRERISDEGALFVDPNSPSAIADAIVRCITQPAEARHRAAIALAQLEKPLVAEVADRYSEVYRMAIVST